MFLTRLIPVLALVACASQQADDDDDDVPPAGGDCAAPLQPGEDRMCALAFGGVPRTYLVHAPASYDPSQRAPLVVDAHGSNETAGQQAGTETFLDWPAGLGSGWRLLSERAGFVVVEPQGLDDAWTLDDVAFVRALPGELAGQANVDPARTYLTGISNGGGLTYWTACTDDGTFAGYAPVSGYDDQPACTPTRHVPLVHFHSPDDNLVAFSDGAAAFAAWTTAQHCTAHAPSWRFGGGETDARPLCLAGGPPWSLVPCDPAAAASGCERWTGCDGGVDAMFCSVAPDPTPSHAWTGGHILYFNGTGLSLAAVAWEALEARR